MDIDDDDNDHHGNDAAAANINNNNDNAGLQQPQGRIVDNRLKERTKKQYDRKCEALIKYLESKYPQLVGPQFGAKRFNMEGMDADIFESFFEHISKKTGADGAYLNPIKRQSFEHVSGYNSAIKYHYKKHKVVFQQEWSEIISEFLGGYERLVADLKKQGVLSMKEGKLPLSFVGYNYLAKQTWNYDGSDFNLNIFAHLFLLLCWNLIARCVSVSGLMFDHISWIDDSLTIVFPTHKGDQEGRDAAPKHVFANPSNPEMCPVLSLAIFVFCHGFRRAGSKTSLFGSGENEVESRFGTWLRNLCSAKEQELVALGMIVKDIGTHSFRKGIASFLSGIPGGPSPVSIYLRAGWSLGAVQKRYIMEGQGGDQLCGRAATGLSLTSPDFAQLPPHFDISAGNGPILSEQEWQNILPGYATFYPISFRPVIPYLLASLAYHFDFLNGSLHVNHPLRLQRVWTSGVLNTLRTKVFAGVNINTTTKLAATGIPPHIIIANQVVDLRTQMNEKFDGIGDRLNRLPEDLRECMTRHFQIQGAFPITYRDVETLMQSFFTRYMGQPRNQQEGAGAAAGVATNPTAAVVFRTWSWGGRWHPVPEGFLFPKCTVKEIWDLWWSGNVAQKITYYRQIHPGFDLPKSNKQYYSKAKYVINRLVYFSNVSETHIAGLTLPQRDILFESCFVQLFSSTLDPGIEAELQDRRRFGELTYIRVYDRIKAIDNA